MLRKIFEDDILQMYSFVGQKKKKIFSSLGSFSIIIGKKLCLDYVKILLCYNLQVCLLNIVSSYYRFTNNV